MKKLLSILLVAATLLALPTLSLAQTRGNEPLHNVNLDQSGSSSFAHDNYFKARWITVSASISGPATVQLVISLESNNKVVYDKTFEEVNGTFTSPEIFLEFVKSETIPYRVELWVNGNRDYNVIVHRMLLLLNGNNLTTRGIRFREYDQDITDKWFMFTPIDFANISANNGAQVFDLIGSNMYIVGKLTLIRNGDQFMFTMQEIDGYNATHPDSEQAYDRDYDPNAPVIEDHDIRISGVKIAMYSSMSAVESVELKEMPNQYELDKWYSINSNLFSSTKQILYLNGRISYDPNGLERIYDNINSNNTKQLLDLLSTFPQVEPR